MKQYVCSHQKFCPVTLAGLWHWKSPNLLLCVKLFPSQVLLKIIFYSLVYLLYIGAIHERFARFYMYLHYVSEDLLYLNITTDTADLVIFPLLVR